MKKLISDYDLMLAGSDYPDEFGRTRYYNAETAVKGSVFNLEIQPDNIVDPLAVIAKYKNKEVGFVPKYENLEIAHYLSLPEQFIVECKLKKKIDNTRTYETLVVNIYIFAIIENYEDFDLNVFNRNFPDYEKIVQERKLEMQRINAMKQMQNTIVSNQPMPQNTQTKPMNGCLKAFLITCIVFTSLFFLLFFLAIIFGK